MGGGPVALGWSHGVGTRGGGVAGSIAGDSGRTVTLSGARGGRTFPFHLLRRWKGEEAQ